MSNSDAPQASANDRGGNEQEIPRVVSLLGNTKVVINRGRVHGVRPGQRFLVFRLSDEPILDPVTGENLGHLEIVRGTGVAVHVQERMSTIKSDVEQTEKRKVPGSGFMPSLMAVYGYEEVVHPVPFDGAVVGDSAKPV